MDMGCQQSKRLSPKVLEGTTRHTKGDIPVNKRKTSSCRKSSIQVTKTLTNVKAKGDTESGLHQLQADRKTVNAVSPNKAPQGTNEDGSHLPTLGKISQAHPSLDDDSVLVDHEASQLVGAIFASLDAEDINRNIANRSPPAEIN